jgi:predicted N-acetyltransferase YhbS
MDTGSEYLPAEDIDDATEQELRRLLSTCYTRPGDEILKEQSHFGEPYPYRWIVRDGDGVIVAHMGVVEREVVAGEDVYRVGGVAAVCVHPDCRGRGHVRVMLRDAHAWMVQHGFDFAMLFGDPRVYGSSGYVNARITHEKQGSDERGQATAMVCEITDTPWPSGPVHLRGFRF